MDFNRIIDAVELDEVKEFCKQEGALRSVRQRVAKQVDHNHALRCIGWQGGCGQKELGEAVSAMEVLRSDLFSLEPEPTRAPSSVSVLTWMPPIEQQLPKQMAAVAACPEDRKDIQSCIDYFEKELVSVTSCVRHDAAPQLLVPPKKKTRGEVQRKI